MMNRSNQIFDELPDPSNSRPMDQTKMTISARTIAASLAFPFRAMLAGVAIAATALPGVADARGTGRYDGVWNVVFATTRGNCSSGYSVPFTVAGGRVSSAGGGRVRGSVAGNGRVAVNVSVGASRANGGGRLAGNSGAGSWSGIISGDRCSGTWQASRG
jgi:hypothetical protein